MKIKNYILIAILALVILVGLSGYNSINMKDESVKMAWADLDSSLQRRNDLIPSLVNTVKGYAKHENKTLQEVIAARAKATSITLDESVINNPEKIAKIQEYQGQLSHALGKLLFTMERYPELKADQGFKDLQHQLEGTENRINVARQKVNLEVKEFNSIIRVFPGNIINKLFIKSDLRQGFVADKKAYTAPIVDFS